MSHIQIGISAIRAAQVGLNTSAQNVANASTDGYHRQRVDLVDRRTFQAGDSTVFGGGVDVSRITRLRNATIEQSLTSNRSGKEAANVQLAAFQQIEQALTPGPGSIHALVTQFFDHVEQLVANPAESVLRREVVATAEQLAQAIGDVAGAFDTFRTGVTQDVEAIVETVNDLANDIARLNKDIRIATARGQQPNSLLDQRDRLINELAGYVDVDSTSLLNGADPVVAAGGALIIGEVTTRLSVETSIDGTVQLVSSTGQRGIDVRSGRLGGLVESLRVVDLGIGAEFADWASAMIQEFDTIQATGIGLNGPTAALTGLRPITGIDVPLVQVASLFELRSGELTVTVTDRSGQRQTTVIAVDITSDTLQDVVTRIDVLSGISASINSETGTVAINAAPGFTFDFAGRSDAQPTSQSISGTAQPTVSGTFLGDRNSTWTATMVTGGEVGVSSEVLMRVTDSASGEVIGEFNLGEGYPASRSIQIADGISLAFAPGTLNAGDTFSLRVTSNPDETGLLAGLGLQSLFTGSSLNTLGVNPDIVATPNNLGTSRSGSLGEGRQLDRLIELRSQRLFAAGSETVEERLAAITGLSGILVASTQQEIAQRDVRQLQLENSRDSLSGVDPNEELLEMLQYQRAFQAASRFVTSIDETLDELMRLIG